MRYGSLALKYSFLFCYCETFITLLVNYCIKVRSAYAYVYICMCLEYF